MRPEVGENLGERETAGLAVGVVALGGDDVLIGDAGLGGEIEGLEAAGAVELRGEGDGGIGKPDGGFAKVIERAVVVLGGVAHIREAIGGGADELADGEVEEEGLVGVLGGVDVADLAIALAEAEEGGFAVEGGSIGVEVEIFLVLGRGDIDLAAGVEAIGKIKLDLIGGLLERAGAGGGEESSSLIAGAGARSRGGDGGGSGALEGLEGNGARGGDVLVLI